MLYICSDNLIMTIATNNIIVSINNHDDDIHYY